MFIKQYPDQIELLSFFESEPIYNDIENQHFAYKFSNEDGLSLTFSFNIFEGWIQAVIEFNGVNISQQLIENVSYFKLDKDKNGEYLSSEVIFEQCLTKVEIRIEPNISVKWNTLAS